jgi:hypothetical protein
MDSKAGESGKEATNGLLGQQPLDLYIFVDKSKSVAFDKGEVLQKAEAKLKEALVLLKNEGDRASIYYIHGNTASAGALYSYTFPKFVLPNNANTIETNNARRRYNNLLSQERGKILQVFRNSLKVANDKITEKGTDVIGALEVLSENSTNSYRKHVLIFSDGIQTTNKIGTNASNVQQAEEKALKDLKVINAKYSINKAVTSNTNAVMVLPYTSLATTHNKYLDDYWRKIFRNYGVSLAFN